MMPERDDFKGRRPFLEALRQAHSVSRACQKAKVSRAEVYARAEEDQTFRAEWDAALLEGTEFLEDATRDLAVGKDAKPGKETRSVTRTYDGALLRFLLKARKPDMYGAHPRAGRTDANEPIWMDSDPSRSELGSDR